MTMLLLRYIWISFLLIGCCLPPVRGCYDMYLSPKWYICIGSALLWLANESVLMLRGKRGFYLEQSCVQNGLVACSLFTGFYAVCMFFCRHQIMLSGPYDNPAGLAFCMSVPLAYEIERMHQSQGRLRWLLMGVLVCTVLMILCTRSRTGVIALSLSFLLSAWKSHWARVKRIVSVILIMGGVVCMSLLSIQKSDSTSGRSFIMGRTLEMIAQHPVRGYGPGGFHRHYMDVQAAYFASHPHSSYAELADEVSHPLCEFLQVWTDYGLVGLLLLACALFVPFINYSLRPPSSADRMYGLSVPLVVFSCFSYPFHYPMAWFVLLWTWIPLLGEIKKQRYLSFRIFNKRIWGVLCFVCALSAFIFLLRQWTFDYEWDRIARWSMQGHSREMMPRYRALALHKSSDALFLYNYAMEQFYAGELESASQTAEACSQRISGYNLELLRGDIFRLLGQNSKAMYHYQHARQMCPVRFAPLSGMLMIYAADGQKAAEGEKVAREILDKRVKVPSPMVEQIREQAKDYLNRQVLHLR